MSTVLAVLFVSSVAFSIGMSILYARVANARNQAVIAEGIAQRYRSEAEHEATIAHAVSDFLIHDVLAAAAPAKSRGKPITVEDAFRGASANLSTAYQETPPLRALLLAEVGKVYRSLGLDLEAVAPLREADALQAAQLGNFDPATLDIRRQFLEALLESGGYAEAEPIAEKMYEALRTERGEDHLDTIRAAAILARAYWLRGRAAEAIDLHRFAYGQLKTALGEDHPEVLHSLSQWALFESMELDNLEADESLFRRAMETAQMRLGEDHPSTLRLMTKVAVTVMRQRRYAESDDLLSLVLTTSRRVLGKEHLDTLSAMVHMAVLREQQGRLDEAESLCRFASRAAAEKLGMQHPTTLWATDRLGHILGSEGDYADGLKVHVGLLEARRNMWGESGLYVANAHDGVGFMLYKLGRFEESADHHRKALEIFHKATDGRSAPAWTLRCLSRALGAAGRTEEARPFTRELLDIRRQDAEFGQRDAYALNAYAMDLLHAEPEDLREPATALHYALNAFEITTDEYDFNRFTVALAYEANGRMEEATAMLRRALAHAPLEDSETRRNYEAAMVRTLETVCDPDHAEDVYRDTLEARREIFPPCPADIAVSLFDLGKLLTRHGKYEEAEAYLGECLGLRESLLLEPSNATCIRTLTCSTAETLLALGQSFVRQRCYEEARPLLQEAFDRLANNEDCHAELFPSATHELMVLFQAIDQPELVSFYRNMLPTTAAP